MAPIAKLKALNEASGDSSALLKPQHVGRILRTNFELEQDRQLSEKNQIRSMYDLAEGQLGVLGGW